MAQTESGKVIKTLREQTRMSQAELAHVVGVSQRHLSCIETSKSHPSREMLAAILDALEPSLSERNRVLLSFGYAPGYPSRKLEDSAMGEITNVIDLMLSKHEPYPAIVLDVDWNIVRLNSGVGVLLTLLGIEPDFSAGTPNLIELMLAPGGLLNHISNKDEVMPYLVRRLQSEAVHLEHLRPLLDSVPTDWRSKANRLHTPESPVLVTRFLSESAEELAFMTTITTFGTPLDITVESLRIELLYPVNESARRAFQFHTTTRSAS